MLLLSALWRAQVSHIAVFALIPGIAALSRAAIGIVLLPFLLVGAGDRVAELPGEVRHLAEAGCWIALAPCSLAERSLFKAHARPQPAQAAEVHAPATPEPEPFLPMPTSFTVRHAWFCLWLGWFLVFLWRREKARNRFVTAP